MAKEPNPPPSERPSPGEVTHEGVSPKPADAAKPPPPPPPPPKKLD